MYGKWHIYINYAVKDTDLSIISFLHYNSCGAGKKYRRRINDGLNTTNDKVTEWPLRIYQERYQ